jgi:HD-GYP domain-containing protein (c-di-GMP phosphodiesterase class II)
MAGLLHDLGKAMIPMEILNKPGKLTDEEFALVKTHPEEGHQIAPRRHRHQR